MNELLSTPLSDQELDWLDNFLLDRIDEETDTFGLDEGILGISELDGLMTAIISGPVMVPPSQWLPQIWGDFEPDFDNEEDSHQVLSLLIRHFNSISDLLMEQPQDFQPLFLQKEVDGETYTIVYEWCEGYMRGVSLIAEQWNLQNIDMQTLITPILAFQGEQSLSILEQLSSEEINELQKAILPSVRKIHAYWLAQRQDPQSATSIRHKQPKVGRNDPCPCGSGKKYKKCCLH
ncbi:MAG: UPF0149 family protein [gamma proteobacterium symbiont of Bathyaustriella thionipta]|nr:UPF0149 family protein [gamma proteobacterium symbiont of Bathyaustriella thionipta]